MSRQEQIDALNASCAELFESDTRKALALARRALRLSKSSGDRERAARSALWIGASLARLGRNIDAIVHLTRALEIGREVGDSAVETKALHQIGVAHTNTGAYPAAAEFLQESLSKAQAIGDRIREALVHNSLGVLFDRISLHPRALDHYQQSRTICEELGNRTGLFFINNNIGTIYLAMNNVPKAYESFLRNTDLMDAEGNEWQQLLDRSNRATALYRLGRRQEAASLCDAAIELARRLDDPHHESYLVHLLAEMTEDRETRLSYQQQALELARRTDDPSRLSIASSIGQTLLMMNRRNEALEWLEMALREAEEIGDLETGHYAHKVLYEMHEREGEATLALKHHKRCTELTEKIRGQEQQRAIVEMEMRADIERAERDREILRLEKLRLEEEMAHKTSELTTMALNLIEKNQFLQALKNEMAEVTQSTGIQDQSAVKGLLRKVDGNLHTERDWKAFETQFERVHQGFLHMIATLCPSLTRTELKVCVLLKLNMSSKEVADLLSISTRTAEHHRYRIRKKLALPDDVNISTYFAALGR